MKRLLSYIYPITKRISSKYSGVLELTWYNGKQVLNTQNANYSYGSLQKILAYSLSKINLKEVNDVLLLGLGAGSVVQSLRRDFQFNKHITAVEFDEVIIKIAKDTYGVFEEDKLEIVCTDASSFVQSCNANFDLIIIDLFIDCEVPKQFYEQEFIANIKRLMTQNGTFIFNLGMDLDNALVKTIQNHFGAAIDFQVLEKLNGTNTVLIGQRGFS
jgi:spermidine synthase